MNSLVIALLCPAIQIVVVIHGFVGRPVIRYQTDEIVGRIRGAGGRGRLAMAEVLRHRLAHEGGHAHAAPARAESQLLVLGFRQTEVRGDIFGHCDTTIPRYRTIVNRANRSAIWPLFSGDAPLRGIAMAEHSRD
jgi:hypothetical protein